VKSFEIVCGGDQIPFNGYLVQLVEIKPLQTNANDNSGIRLLIDGIEIAVAKGRSG